MAPMRPIQEYLRPLLGSGMPNAFRLRHRPVAKVLQAGR